MTSTTSGTSTENMSDATAAPSESYHCEITAPVTAEEAFDKIARVSEWWARTFEGSARALNDVFTIHFGPESFVTFRVTELVPNTAAAWRVTDCYLGMLNDKTEWTGTTAVWKISEKDHATTIQFAHLGIVPAVECYDMCVKGWDQYVKGSLLKLLMENTGQPA